MKTKYQWIRQQSGADCAAASFAIIAKHHGRTFKISRLREILGTGKGGTTLLGLKQGAESLGFWAKAFKSDRDRLNDLMEKLPLPAIIYWKGYHFVVLYGREGEKYVISDPGMGIRYLSRSELLKGWQGGLMLLLTPHPFWFLSQQGDRVDPWGSALQRLYPYRWTVLALFLLGCLLGVLSLTLPIFLQLLVDRVLLGDRFQILPVILFFFCCLQGFHSLLNWGQLTLASQFSQKLQTGLKLDFGEQILQLPLTYHEARYDSVVRGVLRDIQGINRIVTQTIVTLPQQTLSGLAAIALLGIYNLQIALVASAIALFVASAIALLDPEVRQASYRTAVTAGNNLFFLSETFKNALTIKTIAVTPHLAREMQNRLEEEAEINSKNANLTHFEEALSQLLLGLGSLSLLAFTGYLYGQQYLSLGQLVSIYGLNLVLLDTSKTWVRFWLDFTQVKTAAQLLDELFDCTPENLGDEAKPWQEIAPHADICCQNLQFQYPGRLPILSNLNVTLPGGGAIAIIGYSGCGKSTFAKLLTRLYDLPRGEIKLGDHAIADFPLDCLRRQVVLVPQEAEFLTRSITENLQLAQPEATFADIQKACEIAAADEFIATFPEGYNTILGTFSANLSGGQKQRIAIARALLINPPLLILDEATANLDPPTEKRVMDRLLSHRKGQTTLLISHRPNVIERADWVFWIDEGMVKFAGTMADFRTRSPEHLRFLNP